MMAEDHRMLLAEFEVRVRDLMAHCERQRCRIGELERALTARETGLRQAEQQIEMLTTQRDNMLAARVVAVHEGDVQRAKERVMKMIREVNRCIALAE
jgi:hypothetical protein